MTKDFTILIEEDYGSNNICAYVPELRLNVVGDTEEEVIICVQDLIQTTLEEATQTFVSKIVTVPVKLPNNAKFTLYSSAV
ncbi:hypothetical protein YDYSY3_39190 [Paenibacillus chitinolyticus]|uniref:type II toxin-antitoxin system HicB family antitoxin n=1 Tax=Paenibacillus chitinolyticus TaxID=79263 RepID=UPI0026E4F762|nr:type II toxin-antitoxin system HicB family antitoxin [Paenibacillus chitinolyticus]GKS12919.1 hypothetical protein YDYSY3_39190 [Paenibacillus chitinolyticus]